MKLEEANDIYSNKRKWEFDHIDRKAKRSVWRPKIDCDIDVLQSRIRSIQTNQVSNSERLRVRHAVMYPVNCDPVDGVTPNHYMMQVRRTSCTRCLQGEPGHFRHILEK
ncbi:hypothetical protein Anas_01491 [Armadillidium nasatum]|uniref:Uncharacterized protein n=1 Tax=Armadillidium nasatum TaxID=96803 RepID=A0A5N5TLM4_9CRUS|nr:hypothetical protein Anas_01491 [Armadillidium nasatum]